MASTSCDILITKEWKNNALSNENLFNEFMVAYTHITGEEETEIKLDRLLARLDKLGFDKHPKLEKLFDILYVVKNPNARANIITGFFDATEFLNNSTNINEKYFSLAIAILFLNCGAIVRLGGIDYFPGDDEQLRSTIKKGYGIN